MDNENMEHVNPEQDDEVILPEGYKDGDNIFDQTDEPEGFSEESGKSEDEQEGAAEESVEQKAEPGENKQEENPPAAQSFRIRHGDSEVEIKEIDLPDLYRRAQEHDSMSGQLRNMQKAMDDVNIIAKELGFTDVRAMVGKAQESYKTAEIQSLVEKGHSEDEAKEIVNLRVEARLRAQREEQARQATPKRDFRAELGELVQHRPDVRENLANGGKLPQEVITACVRDGIPLRAAYAEYETKEAKAETERIRRENEILRQNEANAKKAPVKGSSGGGTTKQESKDPFLEGLLSDD